MFAATAMSSEGGEEERGAAVAVCADNTDYARCLLFSQVGLCTFRRRLCPATCGACEYGGKSKTRGLSDKTDIGTAVRGILS